MMMMRIVIGSLNNHDVKGKENANRLNRLRLGKQQLCSYTLFCTFPCPRYTTMTSKLLVSPFLEDVNKHKTTTLYLFIYYYYYYHIIIIIILNLDTVLYNSTSEKLTNIR